MTNLDARPEELAGRPSPCRTFEIVEPRDVPLGGIRAMTVRRSLPARGRPFIGSWCFADHYGPDDVAATGGMDVPPHPHTGLATVSWLFRGEIEHRDSLGTHALVRPGELNLMTSGRGIAHSEVSTATTVLHGVQLWLALPAEMRGTARRFEHFAPDPATDAGATWRVFIGEIAGIASPVGWHAPTVGAELSLAAGAAAETVIEPDFEYGVLVDTGRVAISTDDGSETAVGTPHLAVLPVGGHRLRITAENGPARVIVLGGTPMTSGLVMWWNFVGGSHEEIVQARADWQAEIGAPRAGGRFGPVIGYDGPPLPAPVLPRGRLKPRTP